MQTNKYVLRERAAVFARIRAGRMRDDHRATVDALAELRTEIAHIIKFSLLSADAVTVSGDDLRWWRQILDEAIAQLEEGAT
jgi:hypothetical protein